MQFLPNSSLENKTRRKKQEISLLRFISLYMRSLKFEDMPRMYITSGIFSRYVLNHVIVEIYRAIKLEVH